MRIVFKKTIVDKVDEAIEKAQKDGREIETIYLNREEWRQYIKLKGICLERYQRTVELKVMEPMDPMVSGHYFFSPSMFDRPTYKTVLISLER